MDDIRQEMPNEGPILKLNKRLKQKENPRREWKIEYFQKVESLLIQKRENISIIFLVYSQRLLCILVAESFLVCQPKSGGVLGPKAAPE